MVTIAVLELSQGYREPSKPHVLEVEGIDEENRLAVLFSRVLLTDLRRNVRQFYYFIDEFKSIFKNTQI